MKTAILAIILFCIMIFPHELGHYIAAKRMGVKVNEFLSAWDLLYGRNREERLFTA